MIDILLTNDDGFKGAGFYPLLKELSKIYRVHAVVPLEQASWTGKAISAHRPLTISQVMLGEFKISVVDGTAADCVQLGLYELLAERPRLVVSGINAGANTGHGRILSSGTIGAAMEASIDGLPAVASSLSFPSSMYTSTDFYNPRNYRLFEDAACITARTIALALGTKLHDDIDILSLNIPYGADTSTAIVVTTPHRQPYGKLFTVQQEKARHASPPLKYDESAEGTDIQALKAGKISLTPLNLNLVTTQSISQLSKLLRTKKPD